MKRLFITNLCRVESKICPLLLEVFRLNYSQHLNRILEKVQRLWRDQMWNLLSHFSFGKPSWFGVSQSFWACVVMWCVSFSWQYAFFFFRIKFWTAFPASLYIPSSTWLVKLNCLHNLSRIWNFSAISLSNHSLYCFLFWSS